MKDITLEFPDDSLRNITVGFVLMIGTFVLMFTIVSLLTQPVIAIDALLAVLVTGAIVGSMIGISYLLGKAYYTFKDQFLDSRPNSPNRL